MPTPEEKIDMCIRLIIYHLNMMEEYKAVREMRKHAAWYIKGLNNCTEVKK